MLYATDEDTSSVLSLVGLPETGSTTSSVTYANWAHLPKWINSVLGDDWHSVAKLGYINVTEATTHAFWCLEREGAEIGTSPVISINVHVASQTDANGVLDMAASKQAARCWLASIIASTSNDVKSLWIRGDHDEFGDYSVQYAEGILHGRVVVVAGPTVVDIRGISRTAELFDGCARRLLEYTVGRNSPPLTMPVIKRGPFLSMVGGNHDLPSKILVRSVDARLSLYFELERPIAAANATTERSTLVFDQYVIEEVTEESVTVKLVFMVQKLGSYIVQVHFADSETMISRTQVVEIEVS
ncbi:uncharacterized protein EV420DRAFT_1568187 [Desarmillaria tabescens]|uniref:Uncharacterized protein n=1 Tax=Armillaria tabescens TaxID=1929756 RepID=A0AA39JSC0_ARMTA|nr:uncharacterized protein EV420DRAFT_1568187 [Desarmillaria tabescens]KAK0447908.1 hypothetical protein EV420DRAFT_1568187 [Desarmillaria tabescens]